MSSIQCFECKYTDNDVNLDTFLTSSGCCPGCGTKKYRISGEL